MKELKQEGWSDECILEFFQAEDFKGDVKRIEGLKRIILKQITGL